MTQEEIKEYNRMCAVCLGYVNATPTDKDFNIHKNSEGKTIETNFTNIFTNDWNAIMEVYTKIRKIDIRLPMNGVRDSITPLIIAITTGNKEAVVHAINQFLIWYNKNHETRKQ